MLEPEQCWRLLRASRADPPALASTGARRRAYGAALEQSEQLWRAGLQVGETVSPMVLYYALSQGTQAVLATRVAGNGWRPIPSHGLRPDPVALAEDATARLDDFRVHDEGNGYFHQIARLLNSPTLPHGATLAALVSSLPRSERLLVVPGSHPAPLEIVADDGHEMFNLRNQGRVSAWVSPLPHELLPDSSVINPSDPLYLPSLEEIRGWLAPYATLSGDGAPSAVLSLSKASEALGDRFNSVRLGWDNSSGEAMDWVERRERLMRLIDYPAGGVWTHQPRGVAIPTVGGNTRPLHPMATWWAILYSMSMVARYQPIRWTRLLDLDKSPDAELVREVLEDFTTNLPWLVLAEVFAAAP